MDQYVVDYLKSGRAWLLVGSGPSSAVGYPDWRSLASSVVDLCKAEATGADLTAIERHFSENNYPAVFEAAAGARLVGMPRMLRHLDDELQSAAGRVRQHGLYEHIARWPVAVYLTTNFDHQIAQHLASVGERSYLSYTNSEDHMSALLPETNGAIVHLHGDLRSEKGLILTASQYRDILDSLEWRYWRTKMTSIFQMNRVIVIGHSLLDPHIKHVLEAAKEGAGVVQPVCWIAPNVDALVAKDYLERFRIRVIPYDNRDGTHRHLIPLIDAISEFIPARAAVRISPEVAKSTQSPLGIDAAAPGFFVFTKLSSQANWEEKRVEIMVAALKSVLSNLAGGPAFSIQQAMEAAGWPAAVPIPAPLAELVASRAVSEGLLVQSGDLLSVHPGAEQITGAEEQRFAQLRARFQQSLQNRLRRTFTTLPPEEVETVAADIEMALVGYFRDGGLTLASTLMAGRAFGGPRIPSSVLPFINEAAAKYGDYLKRQAFSTISVQAFVHAEATEREYLGRISQGFFAFHLLGAFGEAAFQRIAHARDTVWIIDSSAQIPAIALGSTTHLAFLELCKSLSTLGVRLFTTEGLFDETREHLWFANKVVREFGAGSPQVIAAARGDIPYRKGNLFLEGFINWQSAGNPCDWDRYLIAITGEAGVNSDAVRRALRALPIEVVMFQDWPGFSPTDYYEFENDLSKITKASDAKSVTTDPIEIEELRQKAIPETEAAIIVLNERSGKYHMLSPVGQNSHAWFISQTGIVNIISTGERITWHPEAFMRFASTLTATSDQDATDRAFDTLVWSLAQSGVVALDDRVVADVFGGIIDQARLTVAEQHAAYEKVLSEKYGEPIDQVLERVPTLQQPLAALQLANELAIKESEFRKLAEALAEKADKRAKAAEAELATVQRYRQKVQEKQRQAAENKRKNRAKRKKRKKKK